MTVAQLLNSSYRLLMGDDEPSTDNLNFGLLALNAMLNEWSTRRNGIFTVAKDVHTLVVSDGEYSIGSGADIDTARPIRLLGAYITENNSDFPMRIIDRNWWNRRAFKTLNGLPSELYYEPTYPNGTIRIYPEPATQYTITIDSVKPLAQFTALSNPLNLPPEYETALKFNVAIDWAGELGVDPSNIVIAKAQDTFKNLKSLHAQPVQRTVTNPFGGQSRDYDITGDVYYG